MASISLISKCRSVFAAASLREDEKVKLCSLWCPKLWVKLFADLGAHTGGMGTEQEQHLPLFLHPSK